MSKTIFAYTPPGSFYPPYVNLSQTERGEYLLTVRSPGTDHPDHPREGVTAVMPIPQDQLWAFWRALDRLDL